MSKPSSYTAQASPTKRFFVSMLTRDISLVDAILDLLDNCLDGALRISHESRVDYSKHEIIIEFSQRSFSIKDNCGGIPLDVAQNYAFKMGREPEDDRDSSSQTIGMYGIGMKRAIFKMGKHAKVSSKTSNEIYEVEFQPNWMETKEWEPLPITVLEEDRSNIDLPGTTISVDNLYSGVAKQFEETGFCEDVKTAISEHFTLFIQQGLRVIVNGQTIKPVNVEVLVEREEGKPAPYVYTNIIDGVEVRIIVGLNNKIESNDDDNDETDNPPPATADVTAGWTVFCNNRAIIVGDKSRLTGWGTNLPRYHPQFAVITGIVSFNSNKADKLPVTTTKRALDTSSDIWMQALEKMKKGLRIWVNYTNTWKNYPRSDHARYWANSIPESLDEAIRVVQEVHAKTKKDSSSSQFYEFDPRKRQLIPQPEGKKTNSRRIVFSRSLDEIERVSELLFDIKNEKPGIVGDECFNIQLKLAESQGGIYE